MEINEIISKFDNHINIKKIKECFPGVPKTNFKFTEVYQDETKKTLINKQLNSSSDSKTVY